MLAAVHFYFYARLILLLLFIVKRVDLKETEGTRISQYDAREILATVQAMVTMMLPTNSNANAKRHHQHHCQTSSQSSTALASSSIGIGIDIIIGIIVSNSNVSGIIKISIFITFSICCIWYRSFLVWW